jgi:uncharacterized protein YggE
MIRSKIATPALAVLASLAAVAPGAPALAAAGSPPADQAPESVEVSGTGEVSGAPDTLTAEFAVETTAATVGQALDSANAAATKMRDALVKAGVVKADLQTSNFSIGTKVDDKQAITGYTVNEGLTAKIRDLPHAGKVLSAGIGAGGDAARLNGVSFAIENDAALMAQARKGAFADARQKAELYAREAGRPLGRVLTVTETTSGYSGPGHSIPLAFDSKYAIEPGQQQVSVTVTVDWALDPARA